MARQLAGRPDWLPYEEYPFQDRFIDLDGHTIHYIDEGSGPLLLLVNSGMWSFLWRDVIVRLRDRFRCVTLDFPQAGLSVGRKDYRPTVQGNSEVLERFVRALDLHDMGMVVHDLGGPVGLGVAARHPDLFRALVVSQTFGWPLEESPKIVRRLKLFTSAPARFFAVYLNALLRPTAATSFGIGRHLSRAGKRAFLGPFRSLEARRTMLMQIRRALDSREHMQGIKRALETTLNDLPLLVLFGSRNDPVGWSERWRRTFPRSRKVVIDGAFQFPQNYDPDGFAAAIASWWDEDVVPSLPRTAAR
jgi:haloalkane dehalogenase